MSESDGELHIPLNLLDCTQSLLPTNFKDDQKQNTAPGPVLSLPATTDMSYHCGTGILSLLPVMLHTPQITSSNKTPPMIPEDDFQGVLECLDSDKDVSDLVSTLLETEGELKGLLDDVSFLNFPDIFTDVATPSHECVQSNALVPSVSWEYLIDKESNSGDTPSQDPTSEVAEAKNHTETDVLSNHPLLPLLRKLLHSDKQCPKLDQTEIEATTVNFCEVPEADEVMMNALITTNALLEDKHVRKAMQDIDQDCETISSQISSFCFEILKKSSPEKSNKRIGNFTQGSSEPNSEKKNFESRDTKKPDEQPEETLHMDDQTKKTTKKVRFKSTHKKKRTHIPEHTSQLLRQWLLLHAHHPYPDEDEKDELCLQTGLSLTQINNWFVNARRRILGRGLCNNAQTTVTK